MATCSVLVLVWWLFFWDGISFLKTKSQLYCKNTAVTSQDSCDGYVSDSRYGLPYMNDVKYNPGRRVDFIFSVVKRVSNVWRLRRDY